MKATLWIAARVDRNAEPQVSFFASAEEANAAVTIGDGYQVYPQTFEFNDKGELIQVTGGPLPGGDDFIDGGDEPLDEEPFDDEEPAEDP